MRWWTRSVPGTPATCSPLTGHRWMTRSSAYVAGGVVAYSNAAKTQLLGVPAELIEQRGAVSPEVARAMADEARQRFGAGVGVGITGAAGPGGGTDAEPGGYGCVC